MKIYENFPEIRLHLKILQSVIERMAFGGLVCKIFYITGLLWFPKVPAVLILLTLLFWGLDSYYLGLERRFRDSYNLFVKRLHSDDLVSTDFFSAEPEGGKFKAFFGALKSISVLPFYLVLFLILIIGGL